MRAETKIYKGWECWHVGDGTYWWGARLGCKSLGASTESALYTLIDHQAPSD